MEIQTLMMIPAAMVLFAMSKISAALLSCTRTSIATEVDINHCYEASQMMCHNNSQEINCTLDNLTLLVQSFQSHSMRIIIKFFYEFPVQSNPVFTALSLCDVEALKLQANDLQLSCGKECNTRKIPALRNIFEVTCSYFPPMVNILTIILFRLRKPVGTGPGVCMNNMSDYKFALINLTGKFKKN